MSELRLSERQLREQQYYDRFVGLTNLHVASLAAIGGKERRPWNPYWYVAELLRQHYSGPHQRLLDVGCGPGSYAVQMACLGYEVTGFDVSPGNIEAAKALAAQHGVAHRTHFGVGVAEQLSYPDSHFDAVMGIDILHHVEIRPAIEEALRVLKPGGLAVFKEPVEAPIFDTLRRTRIGRAIAPTEASLKPDVHITEDERKLTAADLATIRELCAVDERRFRVFSRLEALVGRQWLTKRGASRLEVLDYRLLRLCPVLGAFRGNVVLCCRHRDDAQVQLGTSYGARPNETVRLIQAK